MSRWAVAALAVLLAAGAAAQEAPAGLDAVVTMLESGQLAPAEAELERILARSDSAAARDLLGIALSRQGRLEEAERQFSRAAELAPGSAAPRQHLGRVLLQQGRTEEALAELRAAARLAPLERDLALWLAQAELAAGDDARAEELLLTVADRFDSVRALLEVARMRARRGQNQQAARALDRALELAPNSEQVLVARAKVSLALEAPVPAIRALESLTRMHLTAAEHSYLLGVARLQIGDMPGAIEALERYLELEPGSPLALVALGTALNAQKRFAEAREVAERGIRLAPDSAEALAVLAEAEEGLGEAALAEEHATRALSRQPDHAGARVTIGRIRMAQGRYEEARDAFLGAVASDPEMAKAHYQLSLAFARLGDRESSRKHVEIYRRVREESDQRLIELRTKVGLDAGSGMSRP